MYFCYIILSMKSIKVFIIISTILLAHTAMAAFTSTGSDDNKNKYSLKHLNKLSRNYTTFQLKYRSAQTSGNYYFIREQNGLSMSSPVNTYTFSQKTSAPATFVYPYKYTPKVPKFATPSRPQQ